LYRILKKMTKVTAMVWLLACLLPGGVRAEEPVAPSIEVRLGHSPSAVEKQNSRILLFSEAKIDDDELLKTVGDGLEIPLPVGSYYFRKLEMSDSRIKLWDESDRGVSGKGNQFGLDTFQKITLSAVEGR